MLGGIPHSIWSREASQYLATHFHHFKDVIKAHSKEDDNEYDSDVTVMKITMKTMTR